MGSEEISDHPDEECGEGRQNGQTDDELTSKLSRELSNWRRRRNSGRARDAANGGSHSFQSEPARTIKVRGHETLVIRKSKLAPKPRTDQETTERSG